MPHSSISQIEFYKWYVQKEQYLYQELNKFKAGDLLLFGLFWAPKSQVARIRGTLQQMRDSNISGPEVSQRSYDKVMPPSYFKTNEFTGSFQEITNTYGVPAYKEVNPTVFAIVTFPFLFGVMFGDLAHGSLLFFTGLIMCMYYDKFKGTAIEQLANARYLITMMGFFATFCGV